MIEKTRELIEDPNLKVTWHQGAFVGNNNNAALKRAGFELHEPTMCHLRGNKCKACRAEIGRRWWTSNIEAATRLRKFCTPKALAMMKTHLAALARSRAVEVDIDIPAPPGLAYQPFQRTPAYAMMSMKDILIADEMGVGKTIEALACVNKIRPKSVIVVCPATLVFNWRIEAEKWLVEDRWRVVEVDSKRVEVPDHDDLFLIVNYEKITGDSPLSRSLAKRQWDMLIADEAQYLKNPTTARSQAVIGREGLMRRAHRCIFLTGTPIENYPKEIWPIASAICPAVFGDWWSFAKRYCGLHQEERQGRRVWVSDGSSNLGELQQKLRAKLMIRRLKKDILPELPPKRRQLIPLRDPRVDWSNDPRFKKWQDFLERQYDDALARVESAKTDTEYKQASLALEKVTGVAFEEMSEVRHQIALAKLPMAIKYLDQTLESAEELVVFAHHRDIIDKLAAHFGDRAVTVHGGTPYKGPRSRENAVRDFQSGAKKIFIGQTRAAGVGITLTRASTVVFVEVDWVPAVLSQCEDRLCRIGQKKMVHVIHLVLAGTIEVNMVQKILAKQAVIDRALDKDHSVDIKKAV